jgi:hypothetical protein
MILNWDWRSRYVSSRTMMRSFLEQSTCLHQQQGKLCRRRVPQRPTITPGDRPGERFISLALMTYTSLITFVGGGMEVSILSCLYLFESSVACIELLPQRRVSDSSLHLYPQHCFAKTKLVPNVRGNLERFESHFDRGSWQGGIVWRNLLYGV